MTFQIQNVQHCTSTTDRILYYSSIYGYYYILYLLNHSFQNTSESWKSLGSIPSDFGHFELLRDVGGQRIMHCFFVSKTAIDRSRRVVNSRPDFVEQTSNGIHWRFFGVSSPTS